jgi:hypothetical protein
MSDPSPQLPSAKSAASSQASKTDSPRSGPHFPQLADLEKEPAQLRLDAAANSATADSAKSNSVLRKEHELLVEASRVAEHLQRHFVELDEREIQIARQREMLEQQRRQIQSAATQLERELSQRTNDLKQREDGFRKQMDECEELIHDLEDQQKILGRLRAEFEEERARLQRDVETERANLREDIQAELADDFQKLGRANQELADERRRFAEEVDGHRRGHEAALEEMDRQLEFERQKLVEAVRAELDSERQLLLEERLAWESQRGVEQSELAEAKAELAQEAQRQQSEFEILKDQQAAEHAAKVAAWESELANKQAELEHAKTFLAEETNRQRAELKKLREQQAKEHAEQVVDWDARRDAQQTELDESRALHEQTREETQNQLLAERERLEQDLADRERRFQEEQAIGENRLRFQRDHLEKLRERYPAVNVLRSISRTMPGCVPVSVRPVLQKARELMSVFADMEELIRLGAYRKGSDPKVDRAIAINPALEGFLTQLREERTSITDGYQMLAAIVEMAGADTDTKNAGTKSG